MTNTVLTVLKNTITQVLKYLNTSHCVHTYVRAYVRIVIIDEPLPLLVDLQVTTCYRCQTYMGVDYIGKYEINIYCSFQKQRLQRQ